MWIHQGAGRFGFDRQIDFLFRIVVHRSAGGKDRRGCIAAGVDDAATATCVLSGREQAVFTGGYQQDVAWTTGGRPEPVYRGGDGAGDRYGGDGARWERTKVKRRSVQPAGGF